MDADRNFFNFLEIEGTFCMTYTCSRVVAEKYSRTVDLPFCLFVVSISLLNKYIIWLFLVVSVVFGLILRRSIKKYVKLPGERIYLLLVIQCTFVGMFELAQGSTTAWPFFRDLISISLIPLYWIAAQYFISRFSSRKIDFLYNFVVSCSVVSALKLIGSIAAIESGSISGSRVDEWLISISVFLIICYYKTIFNNRPYVGFFVSLVVILEFILGFSRTSIIILLVLLCSRILLYPKVLAKVVFLVSGAVFVASLTFRKQFQELVDKFVRSITEVSSNDVWNAEQITWNWRGFEVYCAKQKFLEGALTNKIFGWGFGSEIDAFGYSHLVTNEGSLPYLHNGYYTMLIKGGLLGLLLLFLFYTNLIVRIVKRSQDLKYLSLFVVLIIAMLITSYVIGGLFVSANFYWIIFFACLYRKGTLI